MPDRKPPQDPESKPVQDPRIRFPHDAFGKLIFRDAKFFAAFVADHLPPALVAEIDPHRPAELLDGSFIDEHLREYHCDVVYRIPLLSGEDHYLYTPIENKSFPDPGIHAQLTLYRAAIWKRYAVKEQRGRGRHRRRLPLVLPVVVYNGQRRWRLPLQAAEQFQDCGGVTALIRKTANLSHLLVDLRRLEFDALSGDPECRALSGVLRGDPGQRGRHELLTWIAERLPHRNELADGALVYVYSQWSREAHPFFEKQIHRVRDAKGAKTMITMAQVHQGEIESMAQVHQQELEAFKQSMAQAHRQEMKDSKAKGKAELVLRLLRLRYKELPQWAADRVAGASAEELELWAERILSTESLKEVFS